MPSAADDLEDAEEDCNLRSSLGGFLRLKIEMELLVFLSEHQES